MATDKHFPQLVINNAMFIMTGIIGDLLLNNTETR